MEINIHRITGIEILETTSHDSAGGGFFTRTILFHSNDGLGNSVADEITLFGSGAKHLEVSIPV